MVLAHPINVKVGIKIFLERKGKGISVIVAGCVEAIDSSSFIAEVEIGDGGIFIPQPVEVTVFGELGDR